MSGLKEVTSRTMFNSAIPGLPVSANMATTRVLGTLSGGWGDTCLAKEGGTSEAVLELGPTFQDFPWTFLFI